MKKWIIAGLISTSCTLAGCSSDYVVATKQGQLLVTQGKPTIDKETGLVAYTDQQGHKIQINGDEISSMIEK